MNNVNQVTEKQNRQKTFWSRFVYPVALFSLLNLANIHDVHAQSKESNNRVNTELSVGELISQLDKKLGVMLPAGYDSKVRNFVQNNYVMQNNNARLFTQNFIIDEMKRNRGISKQNQLLFIWYSIYYSIEKKDLYDGTDGDEKRLEEFETALDFIENCGNQYIGNLKMYIQKCTEESKQRTEKMQKEIEETRQRTEETKQRTEETRQRTEETRQRTEETRQYIEKTKKEIEESNQRTEESIRHIMALDSAGLKSLNNIYNLYKKNPSSVTAGELEQAKKSAVHIISSCKKYGIDYKKLISPEVRRFYGIE